MDKTMSSSLQLKRRRKCFCSHGQTAVFVCQWMCICSICYVNYDVQLEYSFHCVGTQSLQEVQFFL